MAKYWLKEPQKHDFPAAADFLELLFTPTEAAKFAELLSEAKTIMKKAKDILGQASYRC